MLRFDRSSEDELLLEGKALPLESIRSCELAVECWNLRNSLAEADESFNYNQKDLKMQKYTLHRVQNDMLLLRRSMSMKDKEIKQKTEEIQSLKLKVEKSDASRSGIISSYSKTEHLKKIMCDKQARLEVENGTLKSQLIAQERGWQEKYTTMELMLSLDAKQSEKERDEVLAKSRRDGDLLKNCLQDKNLLQGHIIELTAKYKELRSENMQLEDKCAWGTELEQAYEALHELLEISDAAKNAALFRISQLEKERRRVYEYVINEGVQLPISLCADDD